MHTCPKQLISVIPYIRENLLGVFTSKGANVTLDVFTNKSS